jgi:hypothetical protein
MALRKMVVIGTGIPENPISKMLVLEKEILHMMVLGSVIVVVQEVV